MAWTKTSDGSIDDQDGKVIFFSTRRFIAWYDLAPE
jgi:hypothetical protein